MTGALLAAWILLAGPYTVAVSIDRVKNSLELRDSLNRLRESADPAAETALFWLRVAFGPACPCLVLAVRPDVRRKLNQLASCKTPKSSNHVTDGPRLLHGGGEANGIHGDGNATGNSELSTRAGGDAASATLADAGGAEADLQITDAGSEWEPAAETALAETGEPLRVPVLFANSNGLHMQWGRKIPDLSDLSAAPPAALVRPAGRVRRRGLPAGHSPGRVGAVLAGQLGDISGDEEAKEAASSAAAAASAPTDPELATKDAEPQQALEEPQKPRRKKSSSGQEPAVAQKQKKKKKKKAAPVEPTAPAADSSFNSQSGLLVASGDVPDASKDASASAKRRPRRVRQNSVEPPPVPQAQQQPQPLPPCITKSPVRPKRRPDLPEVPPEAPSATPREEATELAEIPRDSGGQQQPESTAVQKKKKRKRTASRTLPLMPQPVQALFRCVMPAASKRRCREAKEEDRKKKQKTEAEEKLDDDDSESDEDKEADAEEEDEDSSGGDDDEAEDTGPEELEWFSLEGCDPEPSDAAAVARLIRRCQLPPWAPAGAAAALAERLTDTPEGRRFASVVKQSLPDEEEEKEADGEDAEDDGVLSVLGIADLDSATGLRECLGEAAMALQQQLLVKARAEELPPELSLPQLEALQTELAQAKSAPSRLLLISPACVAGEGDSAGAEEAVFAEDDILQAAAGLGAWKPLRPPAGRGEADGQSWIYRVCLLDANRLSAAIDRLRQTQRSILSRGKFEFCEQKFRSGLSAAMEDQPQPSQQFALVLQLPWDSAMCQDSSDLITNSSGAAADATGYRMEAANAALCVFNALANGLSMAVFLNRSFARSPACLLLTGLSLFETIFQLCQALYLAVGLSLVRCHLPLPGPGLPLLLAGLAAATRQGSVAFQLARNWTLAGLSFHRFEAVCRHGVGRKLLAKSRCIPALAGCGVACAAVALPRLFEAQELVCQLPGEQRRFVLSGPVPFGPVFHSRLYQLLYLSACLFLLQSGGPVLVVTVCSARVLRTQCIALHPFSITGAVGAAAIRESRNLRRRRAGTDKLIVTLALTFFVLEMPAFFSKLLFAFRALPAEAEVTLSRWSNFLITLDSSMNIFIYLVSNPTYLLVARGLLCGGSCSRRRAEQPETAAGLLGNRRHQQAGRSADGYEGLQKPLRPSGCISRVSAVRLHLASFGRPAASRDCHSGPQRRAAHGRAPRRRNNGAAPSTESRGDGVSQQTADETRTAHLSFSTGRVPACGAQIGADEVPAGWSLRRHRSLGRTGSSETYNPEAEAMLLVLRIFWTASLAVTSCRAAASAKHWVNPGDFFNFQGSSSSTHQLELEKPLEWDKLNPKDLNVKFDVSVFYGACTMTLLGYTESGKTTISKTESPFVVLAAHSFQVNSKVGKRNILGFNFKCRSVPAGNTCELYHMGYLELKCDNSKKRSYSPIIPLGWFVNQYYKDNKIDTWAQAHCQNWFHNEDKKVRQAVLSLACHPLKEYAEASAVDFSYQKNENIIKFNTVAGAQTVQPSQKCYLSTPVPHLSHWYWDLLPYRYCCLWWKGGGCSAFYHKARPSPKLQPPRNALNSAFLLGNFIARPFPSGKAAPNAFMCSKHGTFWLIKTSSFKVQARTGFPTSSNKKVGKKSSSAARISSAFIAGLAFETKGLPNLRFQVVVSELEFDYHVLVSDTSRKNTEKIAKDNRRRNFGYVSISDRYTEFQDKLVVESFHLTYKKDELGITVMLPRIGREFIRAMFSASAGANVSGGLLGEVAGSSSVLAYLGAKCEKFRVPDTDSLFVPFDEKKIIDTAASTITAAPTAPAKGAATSKELRISGKKLSDAESVACLAIKQHPDYCTAIDKGLKFMLKSEKSHIKSDPKKNSFAYCRSPPNISAVLLGTTPGAGVGSGEELKADCPKGYQHGSLGNTKCERKGKELRFELPTGFSCHLSIPDKKNFDKATGWYKGRGDFKFHQHEEKAGGGPISWRVGQSLVPPMATATRGAAAATTITQGGWEAARLWWRLRLQRRGGPGCFCSILMMHRSCDCQLMQFCWRGTADNRAGPVPIHFYFSRLQTAAGSSKLFT
uniref:G_PROTEIN_RECEP_F1_2 domain-containing protein n=1 Tax=Macrostomum lignano TaxID=282301 RepID=A0A1I8GKW1_9PLAT